MKWSVAAGATVSARAAPRHPLRGAYCEAAESAAQPEATTWPGAALLAFAEMNQINQLLRGLLAGGRLPNELSGAQAARRLLAATQQLERRLQSLAPTQTN